MSKLSVALLCGGSSSEREISLKSGEQVRSVLNPEKYNVRLYDPAFDLARLVNDAKSIDVALVILHGRFGEDGTIQGLLDLLDIPYQCSGVLASALAIDKLISKYIFSSAGLLVPKYVLFTRNVSFKSVKKELGLPLVIKPADSGSSIGTSILKDGSFFKQALNEAFKHSKRVFAEEYIVGQEITGAVLGNKRPYALPLIEIVPNKEYIFFDYKAKYEPGATEEICPARLPKTITKKAQRCALVAHKALGCKGYSRTDMVSKGEKVYVLETNTIPGMTENSLFPKAAKEAGLSFPDLIEELIRLALEKG
ncbi:MAG: D-alanine--D-alanine ligase [Syntrophobacter sp. DG_60]|nr:MAG: D-alanine--D-alanine ligase [Syntrophobacter sp. DG_60]